MNGFFWALLVSTIPRATLPQYIFFLSEFVNVFSCRELVISIWKYDKASIHTTGRLLTPPPPPQKKKKFPKDGINAVKLIWF